MHRVKLCLISLFVTLTCPSYGRVTSEGTPVNPDGYDYTRAARDALHFAALFDRFMQNLRRYCGYDIQYFAAIEPQRRLASHVQFRSWRAQPPEVASGAMWRSRGNHQV